MHTYKVTVMFHVKSRPGYLLKKISVDKRNDKFERITENDTKQIWNGWDTQKTTEEEMIWSEYKSSCRRFDLGFR